MMDLSQRDYARKIRVAQHRREVIESVLFRFVLIRTLMGA